MQISTFGRLLRGRTDALPRFEQAWVRIEDPQVVAATGKTHYANVVSSDSQDSRVAGTVFEITDAELAAADEYERPAGYERMTATLASGTRAWVYAYARSSRQ